MTPGQLREKGKRYFGKDDWANELAPIVGYHPDTVRNGHRNAPRSRSRRRQRFGLGKLNEISPGKRPEQSGYLNKEIGSATLSIWYSPWEGDDRQEMGRHGNAAVFSYDGTVEAHL